MHIQDLIYQAAIKAESQKKLQKELQKIKGLVGESKYFIDTRKRDKQTGRQFTAASRLAFENNPKAIWLANLGANPLSLASSLVQGGHHERVKEFYDRQDLQLEHITFAYAANGNKEKAEEYYALYPKSDNPEGMKKRARGTMIAGYASCGDDVEVEKGCAEDKTYIADATQGYLLGENFPKIVEYLNKAKQNFDLKDFSPLLNEIVRSLILLQEHKQIETLYQTFPGNDTLLMIATAYDDNKDLKQARKYNIGLLLDSYLTDRTQEMTKSNEIKEYRYELLPHIFQKSYREKKDAVEALQKALRGEPINLLDHLPILRDGNLGRALRTFIQEGKADDITIKNKPLVESGGAPLRTVTDFVEALNKIVNPKPQAPPPTL
jgi:hypothetical protein